MNRNKIQSFFEEGCWVMSLSTVVFLAISLVLSILEKYAFASFLIVGALVTAILTIVCYAIAAMMD